MTLQGQRPYLGHMAKIHTRVPHETRQALEEITARRSVEQPGVLLSDVIREALDRYVEQELQEAS